jgi:hypothetical protein
VDVFFRLLYFLFLASSFESYSLIGQVDSSFSRELMSPSHLFLLNRCFFFLVDSSDAKCFFLGGEGDTLVVFCNNQLEKSENKKKDNDLESLQVFISFVVKILRCKMGGWIVFYSPLLLNKSIKEFLF